MNEKAFDFLVFIGRFQPFHTGHLNVLKEGLKQSRQLILLCGSAHQPRTLRNPWTIQEREAMIRSCLSDEDNKRLHIAPLMDMMYNDEAWVRNVQATVQGLVVAHHGIPHKEPQIGLIGHSKDHSSYYLNLFPQWGAVNVDNHGGVNATEIRKIYFDIDANLQTSVDKHVNQQLLPVSVIDELQKFVETDIYQEIREEHECMEQYKRSWEVAPYAPTFVTVDALVVQSGHILLIERKARPGKGQMALPGGFVDQHERLLDACIRELREETRLKVPGPVLRGSIKRSGVFDDPYRSVRGRTITHAFYIELEPNNTLPKVKGGDDARRAMWIPLADLDPAKIFEDHYFIIQEMMGM